MRRARRGSLLDLFLLSLVLLWVVCAGARYYALRVREASVETTDFLVELESDEVDAAVGECLAVGERLYTEGGELFGVIESVEAVDAEVRVLSDGVWKEGAWDRTLRCRLRISVRVEGHLGDGVLLLRGGVPLVKDERLLLDAPLARVGARVRTLSKASPKIGASEVDF